MAKTIQSAILGKLIPAIIKAYGKRVSGIDMNKVIHWLNKAQHGLDMLDPAEIVYQVFKAVAVNCSGVTNVYLILTTGQIIKMTVRLLTTGTVGVGSAWIIEQIAEQIQAV